MSNKIEEYVAALFDDERQSIIEGYETLQDTGVVGDEPIRQHAQRLITSLGMNDSNIMIWMCQLAYETYRFYYHKNEKRGIIQQLIDALISAEAEVYLRTQLYPFETQQERIGCWQTLGKIHAALIAAGITVHDAVGLDGKHVD